MPDKEQTGWPVQWCLLGYPNQVKLEKMLDFAGGNYARQTEWFLKYRDRAFTELGALITAECTFRKYMADQFSPSFITIIYIILALTGVSFGCAGILGCRRSFTAAMESIAVSNKAVWALGLSGCIRVTLDGIMAEKIAPLRMDNTFSAPRWVNDLAEFPTTQAFVESRMGKGLGAFKPRNNTCFYATFTIGILALGSFLIGIILAF